MKYKGVVLEIIEQLYFASLVILQFNCLKSVSAKLVDVHKSMYESIKKNPSNLVHKYSLTLLYEYTYN